MIKWYVEAAPVRLKLLIAFGVLTGLTAVATLAPLVAGTAALPIGLAATVAAALAGAAFRRAIANPYVATVVRMEGLAAGDLSSPIEFTSFTDCVGRMTRAMFTFRDTAKSQIEINRLADINAATVRTMSVNMDALAKGDLTAFITDDYPEIYAGLKSSFNAALDNLRGIVQGVVENTDSIRTGSSEIAQASDDLARRTESNAAIGCSIAGPGVRILFYLPLITPWWLASIVEPLIRCLAAAHDVHVLAPLPWRGTGIGAAELASCAHLAKVHWHIADDANHPSMRTNATAREAIIDFVRAIAPDYTLCRSADVETPRGFPGVVRYLMESGAAPLSIPADWIVLKDQPFDHGLLPDLDTAERALLDRLIAPFWTRLDALAHPGAAANDAFAAWAGLPTDRPVLAVPLEYEHDENFFPVHRVGATPNHRWIDELANAIDGRFFLALTNHPLNEKHGDNRQVMAAVATRATRMQLLSSDNPFGETTTTLLMRAAAGAVIGDSKVFSLAAFFGTPMLRRSVFKTGAWLNAYSDLADFLPVVTGGRARAPDRDAARTWFAVHVANDLIDPHDPGLSAADLIARIERPVDPARWEAGIAHYAGAAGGRR